MSDADIYSGLMGAISDAISETYSASSIRRCGLFVAFVDEEVRQATNPNNGIFEAEHSRFTVEDALKFLYHRSNEFNAGERKFLNEKAREWRKKLPNLSVWKK